MTNLLFGTNALKELNQSAMVIARHLQEVVRDCLGVGQQRRNKVRSCGLQTRLCCPAPRKHPFSKFHMLLHSWLPAKLMPKGACSYQ